MKIDIKKSTQFLGQYYSLYDKKGNQIQMVPYFEEKENQTIGMAQMADKFGQLAGDHICVMSFIPKEAIK